MSEWRKIWANGLPDEGRSPKSGHRMAAEGMPFPWRWNGGTISTDLDVIWGMSEETTGDGGSHYDYPDYYRYIVREKDHHPQCKCPTHARSSAARCMPLLGALRSSFLTTPPLHYRVNI